MHQELPARPDLDWYRKQAKDLLRAFERGEEQALERVRSRAGRSPDARFGLSDAQWLIARELGYRTWGELKTLIESRRRYTPERFERFDGLLMAFEEARATWGERGEARLETGRSYDGTLPLVVLARKRPGHWIFSDEARGVDAAGRPRGWLEIARRVVEEEVMNINLRGVVFMSAGERSDNTWRHSILARVADSSVAVYEALLELDGERA